jgi:hypothetical protein
MPMTRRCSCMGVAGWNGRGLGIAGVGLSLRSLALPFPAAPRVPAHCTCRHAC